MKLWIMRHGEAEALLGENDRSRQLTPRGQLQAMASARWLAGQAGGPQRLLVSPYRRARQTAAAMAEVLQLLPEELELLEPSADPRRLCRWLGEQGEQPLLLVSHMPLVAELTGWLLRGVMSGSGFSTAQLCGLDMEFVAAAQARQMALYVPD